MSRIYDMPRQERLITHDFEDIRRRLGKNVNQMAESVGIERQTWTYLETRHHLFPVAIFARSLMMLPASERDAILQSVAAKPLPILRRRKRHQAVKPEGRR
jgi:hypothetical protein